MTVHTLCGTVYNCVEYMTCLECLIDIHKQYTECLVVTDQTYCQFIPQLKYMKDIHTL